MIEKGESKRKNKKTMEKDDRKENKAGRWAMRRRGKRERKTKSVVPLVWLGLAVAVNAGRVLHLG